MALLLAVPVLTGCRVDVVLGVRIDPGGAGEITVQVAADEDVAATPGLTDDLRLDDVTAAGWDVEGPEPADGGGLQVTVSRPFASVEEGTALLAQLNGPSGPLQGVAVTIGEDGRAVDLSGSLRVDGGINAFADPDVLAAVGGTPFADDIAAGGISPAEALTVDLEVVFPGKISTTTGTRSADTVRWDVPLDGTPIDLATTAEVRTDTTDSAWGWVSIVALSLLGVWVVVAGSFLGWVIWQRHRRAAARRARPIPAES
jgi:hypothetical protein